MLYLSLKNPIKKSDLYEAGLCHFQCMKELHPAKTVAHAHGHHHRSAVFSAAPTVVCCRAGHSLLLLLRCKYRKFFRKSSFSAGILFCVKKTGFFCHINERNFVVEKIILSICREDRMHHTFRKLRYEKTLHGFDGGGCCCFLLPEGSGRKP